MNKHIQWQWDVNNRGGIFTYTHTNIYITFEGHLNVQYKMYYSCIYGYSVAGLYIKYNIYMFIHIWKMVITNSEPVLTQSISW